MLYLCIGLLFLLASVFLSILIQNNQGKTLERIGGLLKSCKLTISKKEKALGRGSEEKLCISAVVFEGQRFVHFLRVHKKRAIDGLVKFGLNQVAQNIGPRPNPKI